MLLEGGAHQKIRVGFLSHLVDLCGLEIKQNQKKLEKHKCMKSGKCVGGNVGTWVLEVMIFFRHMKVEMKMDFWWKIVTL